MTDEPVRSPEPIPVDRIGWKWSLALGLLMLVGGLLAFFNPFVASLTAMAIAAAFFFVAGVVQLWMATRSGQGGGLRLLEALVGVVLVLFAISLLFIPLAGLVSLTLLVAGFFVVAGVLRIWLGLSGRGGRGWGWAVGSGAMSLALGVLIFFALPEASASLLGLLLAIDLTASGLAAIGAAFWMRRG